MKKMSNSYSPFSGYLKSGGVEHRKVDKVRFRTKRTEEAHLFLGDAERKIEFRDRVNFVLKHFSVSELAFAGAEGTGSG